VHSAELVRGIVLTRKNHDDRITLFGIKIHPRVGVTLEERSSPQECEADLTVWDNFEGAASRDSIENSIDYGRLLAAVQATAAAGEFSLVETLAYKIVRNILQEFPVNRAQVKVRKRPVSLLDQIDYAEIEVEEP
jgi:dihydroneopterin aldolase